MEDKIMDTNQRIDEQEAQIADLKDRLPHNSIKINYKYNMSN